MANKKVKVKVGFSFYLWISIIFYIMLIVGIFVAVLGINFSKNSTKIEAVIDVIEYYGEDNHSVYINYELDEIQYDHVYINEYSSNWYPGKTINVYVANNNPENVKTMTFYIVFSLVMGLIGLTGAISFTILYNINMLKIKRGRKLALEGKKVMAKVVNVTFDTHVSVNGRYIYSYLICSYEGKQYKSITFKNNDIIQVGDTVPLYINREDEGMYYVDVENSTRGEQYQDDWRFNF